MTSGEAHVLMQHVQTWYGGGQLDAPSCGGKAPKSSDYVVAVPTSSGMKCGDTLHIHRGNRKMVSAVVRDTCAGCAKNQVSGAARARRRGAARHQRLTSARPAQRST
jgi:hypothetical protein